MENGRLGVGNTLDLFPSSPDEKAYDDFSPYHLLSHWRMKMSDHTRSSPTENQIAEDSPTPHPINPRQRELAIKSLVLLVVFALGGGSGYLMGRQSGHEVAATSTAKSPD